MRRLLILSTLLLSGCLSIVNNNGSTPQETNTGLGAVRQLPAEQTMPQVVLLPNGQYAILTPQATPAPIPQVQVNVEGNYLLPSPTPDMSGIARDLPNPPVTRQIVTDCLPCECAPCDTPEPTPTPTPTTTPQPYQCTALDTKALSVLLDNAGYTGQYTFCRALSETLMIDVAFVGDVALLDATKKKEYTVLTRQNVPVLKINNRLIKDELNGKTDAITSWLDCQFDKDADASNSLPALPTE